jgi:hypothetical protein
MADTSSAAASSASPKPRNRPGVFRWTVAIVLLALAAWAGWQSYKAFDQRSIVEHVEDLGGVVYYDYEDPANRQRGISRPGVVAGWLGRDYSHDIVEVNLRTSERSGLSDDDVQKLKGLSALRRLTISQGNEITNEGLALLGKLTRLEKLTLVRLPQVDNAGLSVLARLPELREVELVSFPKISDDVLRHTGELENVHSVSFGNCPIDGTGWQHIKGLPLRVVAAEACEVSDEALAQLAEIKTLEELSLSKNKIRGPGLAHLRGLDKLTTLRLGNNPLDVESALPHLKALASLETLNLMGVSLPEEKAKELSTALPKCDITVEGGSYDPEEGKWFFDAGN